jgi:hypothetical protein
MKRWMLTCFATLSLLMVVAGAVASPAAAAPGGNAANAQACQQGGYANLSARAGGPPFANTGQCVSASAQGTVYPAPSITIERDGTSDVYGNHAGTNILYCFYWKTYYNFVDGVPLEVAFYHDGELESISRYNYVVNGEPRTDIVPFGVTQVIVVTDLNTGEVILTGPPMVCEAAV